MSAEMQSGGLNESVKVGWSKLGRQVMHTRTRRGCRHAPAPALRFSFEFAPQCNDNDCKNFCHFSYPRGSVRVDRSTTSIRAFRESKIVGVTLATAHI